MKTKQNFLRKITFSIRAAILPLALLAAAPMLSAATYTWDNGDNTGLWGTSANWVGDPTLTFDNTTDLIFDTDSVVNRGNAVSIGGTRIIRSLTINADYETSNNATFDIRTYTTFGGTANANLRFEAASGNASINVDQSTSGTVMVRFGSANGGFIVLDSDLDLAQHNTFYDANAFAFDGRLSGTGDINKTGAGVVRLLRNNSDWSGNMNINEGAVRISNDATNAMGTGTWTLGGGGNNTTLIVTKSFNDNPYVNAGGIVVAAGAGTRTISNFAADAGIPILSGNITLNKDAIFDVESVTVGTGDRMTLSGNVTGTGGIVKTNTGILILSGTGNDYSGTTDIQAGKLFLGEAGRLGSGNVTIASGANLDFGTGASQTNVVANNISGDGAIIQSTASTDTRITGNVTNAGGLTIEAGTFRIGDGTTTGSYTGDTVINGGALAFARSNAYTHGGTISGVGGVSKVNDGVVTVTGDNSYSGNTALFGGVLVADHANAMGTGNIVFNAAGGGGTLRYTANSSATDWATRIVTSNGIIRLDTSGNDVNLAGAIDSTNTAGLTKLGAGTLTLGGTNTYTGATTVSAGTLLINGSTASGSTVTVASGGTLGGSGTVGGATTISGTHSPGTSPGIQTFESGLTYDTGATFVWELTGNTDAGRGTNFDGVDVTGGTLTIATGVTTDLVFNGTGSAVDWSNAFWDTDQSWLVFDNAGVPSIAGLPSITLSNDSNAASLTSIRSLASFSWDVQGNDVLLNYAAIPEPSTWALLAGSLTALMVFRRRRGTC
jgi:fibronectin-binding autotransporter adhesin